MLDMQDTTKQQAVLTEVFSAYRYEATEFEAGVWINIMKAVPEARFIAFLRHHYQVSPFAPKPADATKYLDTSINPEMSFQRLVSLVASVGPWADPKIEDPILLQTIHLMGGWSSVNEYMPDVGETRLMKAFRERFDACFNTAITHVRIDGMASPEPLRHLGSSPETIRRTLPYSNN